MVDPEDVARVHEVEQEADQSLLKFRTFGKWEEEQRQLESRRRERERIKERHVAEGEAKQVRQHSGSIQGTFREHSGNIQGTFSGLKAGGVGSTSASRSAKWRKERPSRSVRRHSGNIQGTFRAHSVNIQ
jgi:hypothetical protein